MVLFCLQVVLGFAFRMYDWLTTSLNIHTKTCYTVNRGYNQPPVQSCEGKKYMMFSKCFLQMKSVPDIIFKFCVHKLKAINPGAEKKKYFGQQYLSLKETPSE